MCDISVQIEPVHTDTFLSSQEVSATQSWALGGGGDMLKKEPKGVCLCF